MAFPFFGKKPPAPPRPARPTSAEVQPKAPPPEPEPPPPPELPPLDFVSGIAADTVRSSDGSIELHIGSARVHPVVEEAAMLYANGSAEQAAQSLEALLGEDFGADTEQVWELLLDLYQVLDRRDAFDRLTLDYVVRFERSPPTWNAPAGRPQGREQGAGAPVCNLSGALSAGSAKQFAQIDRLLAKAGTIVLDVAKVKNADEEGCALLVGLLAAARKHKRIVSVQSAGDLGDVLKAKITIGKRDNQQTWLLLLELLQQQDDQVGFDEWALNYAITFEVSPPSWDTAKRAPAQAVAEAEAAPVADPAFAMRGDLCGPCTPLFLELEAYAGGRDSVVIDLSGLKRMDFVCAGMLLNTLSDLARRGKHARLTNTSGLVSALLTVIGVGQVAEIARRRS
jgi:anti-anti-sigma regulatory factor